MIHLDHAIQKSADHFNTADLDSHPDVDSIISGSLWN